MPIWIGDHPLAYDDGTDLDLPLWGAQAIAGLANSSSTACEKCGDSSTTGHQVEPAGAAGARLRVIDVLQRFIPAFLAQPSPPLNARQLDVLGTIVQCQTKALGGHAWGCVACGQRRFDYNSCRCRSCPRCARQARQERQAQVRELLLPSSHQQLIFTQPHELLGLNEANPRPLYQHFFRTVATALRIESRAALGIRPTFCAALQTWGSPMNHHVHMHVCLLCGGLSLDGQQWIAPRDDVACFLDLDQLARTYRDCYLKGLEKLFLEKAATRHPLELRGVPTHDAQGDPISPEAGFLQLLDQLYQIDWVIRYTPPLANRGAENLTDYMVDYLHGGPMSDWRLVSYDHEHVTYLSTDDRQDGELQELTVSGVEFVRLWGQHIPPKGMVRFRRVGLYAGRCQAQLTRCRELLQLPVAETNPVEDSTNPVSDLAASDRAGDHDGEDDVTDCEEDEQAVETLPRCPACQKIPLRWLGYVPGHRTTRRFTRLRPFVPETPEEAQLLQIILARSVCPTNAVARPCPFGKPV